MTIHSALWARNRFVSGKLPNGRLRARISSPRMRRRALWRQEALICLEISPRTAAGKYGEKFFEFFSDRGLPRKKTEKLQLHDATYAPRFCTFFVFFDSGTGVAFRNPQPKFLQTVARARRRGRQATGQAKTKRRPLGRRSTRSEIGQWIRLRASAHAN
jgi:hypothetical protein